MSSSTMEDIQKVLLVTYSYINYQRLAEVNNKIASKKVDILTVLNKNKKISPLYKQQLMSKEDKSLD